MFVPNPYRPGAGETPTYLAGRDKTLEEGEKILTTISYGYPARSEIFYGLRGVGKTVLLNRLMDIGIERGIVSESIEIENRSKSFQSELALKVYKLMVQLSRTKQLEAYMIRALGILKAFSLKYSNDGFTTEISVDPVQGIANTGNISNDISELFLALGSVAKHQKKGVAIFIDEMQILRVADMEALFVAIHRVNQKGYPLVLFGAGLPKIIKIAGRVKSYAERLFLFVKIGSLDKESAALALTKPAEGLGISYTPDAINEVLRITEGYPYFLQEYGSQIWDLKQDNTITLGTVKAAYREFESRIDESFFRVRYEKATHRELEFMLAMVKTGALPCTIRQVANILHVKLQSISVLRAQLIHKGFIYDSSRGEIDFTVPQFGEYLKRVTYPHG